MPVHDLMMYAVTACSQAATCCGPCVSTVFQACQYVPWRRSWRRRCRRLKPSCAAWASSRRCTPPSALCRSVISEPAHHRCSCHLLDLDGQNKRSADVCLVPLRQALESERAAMEAARAALDRERQALAASPLPMVQATPPPAPPQQLPVASAAAQGPPAMAGVTAASGQRAPQQVGSVGATPVAPAAAAVGVPLTLPPGNPPGQT